MQTSKHCRAAPSLEWQAVERAMAMIGSCDHVRILREQRSAWQPTITMTPVAPTLSHPNREGGGPDTLPPALMISARGACISPWLFWFGVWMEVFLPLLLLFELTPRLSRAANPD